MTLEEKLTSTDEGMRQYQRERVILEATELICKLMDEQGVSKSQLARRLGKTKGYITQLLDGPADMTLWTLSDVMCALDYRLRWGIEIGEKATQLLEAAIARVEENKGRDRWRFS